MIQTDSGTGVGTSTTYTLQNYCAFRLPCGICRHTNTICPMWNQPVMPTWKQYEITCVTDVERRSE